MSIYTKFKLWLKGEEKYPDNVSEPIITILKSIKTQSRHWKIKPFGVMPGGVDNYIYRDVYIVRDADKGLTFEVYMQNHFYDNYWEAFARIDWATKEENLLVGKAISDLSSKRIVRLKRFEKYKEDKVNNKIRDKWMEIYK